MRGKILCWHILACFGVSIADAQDRLPYHVVLRQGQVEVRSGPGASHYVTSHLSAGDSIEVYRESGDGWLGIRPPSGSFSWVQADRLASTSRDDVARVTRDDTICRVGSLVAEVEHHVGQVYLEKDERIQLWDDFSVDTQTGRQLLRDGWRRISPPSGEFRWVRAVDVQQASKPPNGDIDRPTNGLTASPSSGLTGSPASGSSQMPEHRADREAAPSPEVRQATHFHPSASEPIGLSTAQVIQAVAIEPQQEMNKPADDRALDDEQHSDNAATDRLEEAAESQAASDGENDADWTSRGARNRASGFREQPPDSDEEADSTTSWTSQRGVPRSELLDIEMRLAMTAARDIHLWRLQPLRDRIESIQARLKTEQQRDHARMLLERVTEYETLQNRFAVAGEQVSPDLWNGTSERTGAVGPPGWEDSLLSRFDGNGWLVPVHSSQRLAPPYALLDAEGEVLFYVAPSPGLNLHRYLRKRVGIYGQRREHPSVNKPWIAAERVVDLGRHLQ
jgi:uncharacterized protein YraI